MNASEFLLFPPVAFTLFLLVGLLLQLFGSMLAAKGGEAQGKHTQYACGEDVPARRLQPDYAVFFPFALFFTIVHVTALVLATLPSGNIAMMGVLYMLGVAVALYTLVAR